MPSEAGFFSAPSLQTTITMKKTAKEHKRASIVIHHPKPIFETPIGDRIVPIAAKIFRTKFRSATTEAPTPGLMSTRNGMMVEVTSMRPSPNNLKPIFC